MLMVEPSFLALMTTPSIAPSSAELTWPVSATAPWACATAVRRAKQAAVTVRQIRGFIRLSSPELRYCPAEALRDRKSTRLNSSHVEISYAVFCLKKKKKK